MPTPAGRAVAIALGVLAGGGAPWAQQTRPVERPDFRTSVELVTVDVTVVDNQGRPIRGLQAPDFAVTVDGEPRKIVTTEFVDASGAQARPAPGAAGLRVSSNEGAGVGRLFVFIVDQQTLDTAQVRQVVNAAPRLLVGLSFADRSALMRLPNGPDVEFTWAHDRVGQELLRVMGTSTLNSDAEFGSLSAARDIANGGTMALRGAAAAECGATTADALGAGGAGDTGAGSGGTTPGPPGGGGQAGGAAPNAPAGIGTSAFNDDACARDVQRRAEWAWRIAQTTSLTSLASLRHALAKLRSVPGDKTVVLVSGGWPLDDREQHSLLTQAADDAAAARATIFTVFVPQSQDRMMQRTPAMTPVEDQALHAQPLETLAGLTGGTAYRAYVSADGAFERLGREASGYYRLGVERMATDTGADRRRLRVRVSREGATVRARELFDTQRFEDRNWTARFDSALRSPVVATGIGLRVTDYVVPDPDGSADLHVVLAGEASRVGPGEASFKLLVQDLQGRAVVSELQSVGEPTDERATFSAKVAVPPGGYIVRVAFIDGTGRTGSVDHPVEVGRQAAGDLRAAGPLLVRVPADGQQEARLALGEVRQDERLAMQVDLAGPEARLAEAGVTFDVAESGDGPALIESAGDLSARAKPGSRAAQGVVSLRMLPPGRYVARARITASGQPLGEVHRAFVVEGRATHSAGPSGDSIGEARASTASPQLTLPVPPQRFAASTALAPPVLGAFLDRVAARPDAEAPQVVDLLARARTSGVERLSVPDALAAGQPVAAFLNGLSLLSRNQLDPAANAFRAALRAAPDMHPALFYLGACYAAGGRDKEAVGAWRNALIKEGDTRALHVLLADALLRQQQGDQALRVVDAARKRWPDDEELKRRFVLAAISAGHYAEGLRALDELIGLHAEDQSTLAAGLLALYESLQAGAPVQDRDQDRARMVRLADAYRDLGGPSVALIDMWLEAARRP